MSRIKNRKKRVMKTRFKVIIALIVLLIIAGLSYAGYLYVKAEGAANDAYEEDERGNKSEKREEVVDPEFDNVSILLMGIDENEARKQHETARTDALILATVNREDHSIKLLSIPRDSYVYIPEVGYEDKITHAHAFGGTYTTIETVEQLFDMPIDYYVKLNFEAFVDVIDAIDGVEVDVPYEFTEQDSSDKQGAIHLYEGVQTLDGEEALAFARTRKKDSDVERGKRQVEIINSIISKAASVSSLFKYDDMIDAVGKNASTNMTFKEMKSFLYYGTHGKNLDVEKINLDGNDYMPGSVYYYQLDEYSVYKTMLTLKNHLEILNDQERIEYDQILEQEKAQEEAEEQYNQDEEYQEDYNEYDEQEQYQEEYNDGYEEEYNNGY